MTVAFIDQPGLHWVDVGDIFSQSLGEHKKQNLLRSKKQAYCIGRGNDSILHFAHYSLFIVNDAELLTEFLPSYVNAPQYD